MEAAKKTETEKSPGEEAAHVVVFGNEKGGTGKSTAAMHAAVALVRLGYRVGTIDLDARQGTLTRYMKNRWDAASRMRQDIPMPVHMAIEPGGRDLDFLSMALDELGGSCDFTIIDTPGSDSALSRFAHFNAGTLVTPVNDSLVDLDVLGRADPETLRLDGPSVYTRMVEEQNVARIGRGAAPMHWIVLRNRLSPLATRNRQDVGALLEKMSGAFGFQLIPGFGERVAFRELFLKGLTLLDLRGDEARLSLSQIAARQEVRQLVRAIGPETIKGYRKPLCA